MKHSRTPKLAGMWVTERIFTHQVSLETRGTWMASRSICPWITSPWTLLEMNYQLILTLAEWQASSVIKPSTAKCKWMAASTTPLTNIQTSWLCQTSSNTIKQTSWWMLTISRSRVATPLRKRSTIPRLWPTATLLAVYRLRTLSTYLSVEPCMAETIWFLSSSWRTRPS